MLDECIASRYELIRPILSNYSCAVPHHKVLPVRLRPGSHRLGQQLPRPPPDGPDTAKTRKAPPSPMSPANEWNERTVTEPESKKKKK